MSINLKERKAWAQNWSLPSYFILFKLFNLAEPQFIYLKTDVDYCLSVGVEILNTLKSPRAALLAGTLTKTSFYLIAFAYENIGTSQ